MAMKVVRATVRPLELQHAAVQAAAASGRILELALHQATSQALGRGGLGAGTGHLAAAGAASVQFHRPSLYRRPRLQGKAPASARRGGAAQAH